MNNYEFLDTLFKTAADALGVQFVKKPVTSLQMYAAQNKPPFIVQVATTVQRTNTPESNLVTFGVTFILILKSEVSPSDEALNKIQGEAEELANRFADMINKNGLADAQNISLEELFRSGTYAGIGQAITIDVTIADHTNKCLDACDETTNKIGC